MWEGWKAGFIAFHAFHTLSFPWPAWGAGSECEVAEIPIFSDTTAFDFEIAAAMVMSELATVRELNPCRHTF